MQCQRMQGTQGGNMQEDRAGDAGDGRKRSEQGMPEACPALISANGAAHVQRMQEKRKEPRYRDSISIRGCIPRAQARPLGARCYLTLSRRSSAGVTPRLLRIDSVEGSSPPAARAIERNRAAITDKSSDTRSVSSLAGSYTGTLWLQR